MEDLSLNDNSLNKNSFLIATRDDDQDMANNPKSSLPHHVSDDIPENSEASPMKRG